MGPGFESLKVHDSCLGFPRQLRYIDDGHTPSNIVGEVYAEGPPVPIPNTEVKLCRAEDT